MTGTLQIHDPNVLANYLLAMAEHDGRTLVPDQLIKLVYLCHGWTLGLLHQPLIGEDIEAWRTGPAIRRLHREVGDGPHPVERRLPAPESDTLNSDELRIVTQVYEQYAGLTPVSLASRTLTQGTPWDIAWRRHGPEAIIAKDLIEVHFAGLARGTAGRVVASAER